MEIVIRVLEDGNIHVTAPFENQIGVRGAMDCALDVVRMMGGELRRRAEEQKIQVARPGEPWYARIARQARGR
jgi:hypothetical protein